METRSLKYARCYLIENKHQWPTDTFSQVYSFHPEAAVSCFPSNMLEYFSHWHESHDSRFHQQLSWTLGFPGLSCHAHVVETGTEAGPQSSGCQDEMS